MSRGSPPLRFVTLVVGGWVCARALFLAPAWLADPVAAAGGGPVAIGSAVPQPWPLQEGREPHSPGARSRDGTVQGRLVRFFRRVALPPVVAQAPVERPSTALGTNEGVA